MASPALTAARDRLTDWLRRDAYPLWWREGYDHARGGFEEKIGFDGRADLAMVIRSIVVAAEGASVGAGGGITALSEPAAEYAEMRLKAAAPLAALGVPAAS